MTPDEERRYIDAYVDALERVSDANKRLLAQRLADIDFTDMTAGINQVVVLMKAVCAGSTRQAAVLAAQFYKGLRDRELGGDYEPVTDAAYDPVATENATRAIAQQKVDGKDDVFASQLAQRVGYETKRAAGETLFANGESDRQRPRYARIPQRSKSYPNGCPFCQMLASRGFVYLSRRSVGEYAHWHDDCKCAVVPSWLRSPKVKGYDPDAYLGGYDKWLSYDHSQHEQNLRDRRRGR